MDVNTSALAQQLDDAARTRILRSPVTDDAVLTLPQAYEVQQQVVAARTARGARIVGGKLGLTSKAKQLAMGVHEPLYALVTSDMANDGNELDLAELIHPRVEPEIAFVLRDPVRGPGATAADVLRATAYVCVALDVIDSRYKGFSFTHLDAIADNGSSAKFLLGNDMVAPSPDLNLSGCVLSVDGVVTDSAAGAAVMGHPANAVAFMANALADVGGQLEAGWVVLSGGLTAPVPMAAGTTVTATVAGIGSVSLTGVNATSDS